MGSDEFSFAELRRAFELRIVHMVMTADEVVRPQEIEFLETVFSRPDLDRTGFLDVADNRFTQRFARAIAIAPPQLAETLSQQEKQTLLALFFRAAEADGDIDPREMAVIVQAGRMLDVPERELLIELDGLMGTRRPRRPELEAKAPTDGTAAARPRARSRSGSSTGSLSRAANQDELCAALTDGSGEGSALERRLRELACSTEGRLTVLPTRQDARECRIHGIEALVAFATRHGSLVALAGRLHLTFDAWRNVAEQPYRIPELRAWMAHLVGAYPWLPVWMNPHGHVASQLIAAVVPVDPDDPTHPTKFIASVVRCANYAVALLRRLGHPLDPVYEYLAQFGIVDVPAGAFDGVDSLADRLDGHGRALGPPPEPGP